MKAQRGFSLIELMVAIAVLVILATAAVPGYQAMIRNNRQTSQLNELVMAFQYARSEAAKRSRDVQVCASSNQTSCSGSTDWEDGWIVWSDTDGDANVDAGEIIRPYDGFSNGQVTLGSSVGQVTYQPTGMKAGTGKLAFIHCDARGASHAKAVVLGRTGRPQVAETDGSGNDLTTCP